MAGNGYGLAGTRRESLFIDECVPGTTTVIRTLEAHQSGFDPAMRLRTKLPMPRASVLGEPAKRFFPEVM